MAEPKITSNLYDWEIQAREFILEPIVSGQNCWYIDCLIGMVTGSDRFQYFLREDYSRYASITFFDYNAEFGNFLTRNIE